MSEPRVIQADFCNWRPVQGRKVLQLILEVPIEQTQDVLAKLGVPRAGESTWVAVALLNISSPHSPPVNGESGVAKLASEPANSEIAGDATRKRKFEDLPLSQQAAIRCGDRDFRLFLANKYGQDLPWTEGQAASEVRQVCCVVSRSLISEGDKSGDYWLDLEGRYQAWRTDRQFAEARR